MYEMTEKECDAFDTDDGGPHFAEYMTRRLHAAREAIESARTERDRIRAIRDHPKFYRDAYRDA